MSIAAPKILVEKAKVRVSRETAYNALMEQRGRPSSYSAEIAQLICDRLATGESLLSICKDENFPTESTVRHWALEDREGFFANYSRARDLGLDCRADKVLEIPRGVTSEDVPRARLEFDAERWYLSKLAPKRYGDAQLIKHADHEGNAMHVKVTRVKGRED